MQTCYIVGAAPFEETFVPAENDLVIAADGGQKALFDRGIRPQLVVGDFDSSAAPKDIPYVRHPVRKDDTDAALAAEEGIRRGYTVFKFYGCMGGAPDHTFANIQLLHGLAKQGMRACLVGEGYIVTVLVNQSLSFSPTGRVSVFSLTDVSYGVDIEGLQYPLQNAVLTSQNPLGVSNRGDGTPARISVKDGALLVFYPQE